MAEAMPPMPPPEGSTGPAGCIPVNSFYGPVHVAITWAGGPFGGADIDISAVAYDAAGAQLDACYFKKPQAMNGAMGSMGDDTTGFGYSHDKEGIFVHCQMLPAEVNYVFFVVNARTGINTLAEAPGLGIRIADGSQEGGRQVATAMLNVPTEGVLAAVLIRQPPFMYPPGWNLHITAGFPAAHGAGRDFNESVPLIEEYLRSMVPAELLANRPPNDPMTQFDLTKNSAYLLDPRIRNVQFSLGWQTTCDLDAHAYLFDDYYQKIDHVYKGDLQAPGVRHSGNQVPRAERMTWFSSNPGAACESITINLDSVPPQTKHIAFFINIAQGEAYTEMVRVDDGEGRFHMQEVERHRPRPHSFAQIPGTFVSLVDPATGAPLTNPFYLTMDGLQGVTRLMAVFTQYAPGYWSMAPLGAAIEADVTNSKFARNFLVQQTRPDLLRPVTIDMGVVSGRGLAAMDSNGKSDPLFSCKFYDHTTSKTKPKKKTLEPQWNEPKMYTWTGPQVALLDRVEAKLDVYDWDRLSMNDFMGRAYLHLREVLGTRGRGPQQRWMTLGPKHDDAHGGSKMLDGILGNSSGKISGEVLVEWDCRSARG